MNKFIVSNGDKVTLDFMDKHIELYIDEHEPLGFKIQMIYKRQNYLELEKQVKPLLKQMVKNNLEDIKRYNE